MSQWTIKLCNQKAGLFNWMSLPSLLLFRFLNPLKKRRTWLYFQLTAILKPNPLAKKANPKLFTKIMNAPLDWCVQTMAQKGIK
jgi:hypothetical protein